MIVEASAGGSLLLQRTAPEKVEHDRRPSVLVPSESERDVKKVSPEELLDKIKGLTEDGMYSVRFEKNKDLDEIVIKVVDRESGEVIRHVPPEELLGVSKKLEDFRGVMIKTEG